MRVSIIICTRGRAERLAETLASISGCEIPAGIGTEVVIVDNNSTGEALHIEENEQTPDSNLRRVCESVEGQCRARNRGIAQSDGEIVLFTDDDVSVPRDWLIRMCQPIVRGTTDAVAGGVELEANVEKRAGVFASWLASSAGVKNHSATLPTQMIGASMAFHRRVLDRVPQFDVELGPGALGFCDETLFSWQLVEAGYRLVGQFDCVVEHRPDPLRVTRKNFLDHAARLGRSDAYLEYHWKHTDAAYPVFNHVRMLAGLWGRRGMSLQYWLGQLGIEEWELGRVYKIAFRNYMVSQQGRPRNYDKRGLVKLRGTGAMVTKEFNSMSHEDH